MKTLYRCSCSAVLALFLSIPALGLWPGAASATTVTLSWEPSRIVGLSGYKVYYGATEKSLNGKGLTQGDSPISISLNQLTDTASPYFDISGLKDDQAYFFAVTAYTADKSESEYSNIVKSNALDTHDPEIHGEIPGSDMHVYYTNSEELNGINGAAENVIDGNPKTIWHTEWYGNRMYHPYEFRIDLGSGYEVGGIKYLPSQNDNDRGAIANYRVYVSVDGNNWGSPVIEGALAPGKQLQEVIFSAKTGRFFRFVALSQTDGHRWASMAEINILGKISNDTDGDGITDTAEAELYGTDPYKADTDGDGISDGNELALWGNQWQLDVDGDGAVNLLDWDTDGDSFSDGDELAAGTDLAGSETGGGVLDECPDDPNKNEPGFCGCGIPEGTCGGFDHEAYLAANPDLPQDWGRAIAIDHYIRYGFRENRASSFDLDHYLLANPDLTENWTYEAALTHYNSYGKLEGRLLAFDPYEYASLYDDLPSDWTYEAARNHYLTIGRAQGRIASFDEDAYLQMYADLPRTWGQKEAFYHYLFIGRHEGRVYDPYDETVFQPFSKETPSGAIP